MNKVKIFLTVLSILITVTPIATQLYIHRDNVVGLVIPPAVGNMLTVAVGDISTADAIDIAGVSFQLPVLSDAYIFSQNNTAKMIYTFTNPLNEGITLTAMDAEVVCVDHKFVLGKVSIEPTPFGPNQTLDIPVTCVLSTQALKHIATEHQGKDSINTEFKNFSVDLIGVKIRMDTRKLGDIQIKMLTPFSNNQIFR